MAEKFFRYPFAASGDKVAIPDPTQVDGSVSYEKGFTVDYQLDQASDPDAKDIPRDKFNSLMSDVTEAIRQIQTTSAPSFITSAANGGSPFSYAKSVVVQWTDGKLYQSLVASNTADPTDATKWQEVEPVQTIPDASETVKGILELATAAEAIGGTDTLRAVTSAGLAAFKNLAASGYMKFPGGFIIQWGTASLASGGSTITLPIAYTTENFGVFTQSLVTQRIAFVSAKTLTNFDARGYDSTSGNFFAISTYYFSVGK